MVLLETPAPPKRWQFKEKPAPGAPAALRQTTLTQFANVRVGSVPSPTPTPLQRSAAQLVPDEQRDWVPPKHLVLTRKGFLVRTDVPENREIVARLLRDLTYNYPESNFDKQQRKKRQGWKGGGAAGASGAAVCKPPLQCFCSQYSQNPEQLLLDEQHQPSAATADATNHIGETADWLEMQAKDEKSKVQRAQRANYLLVPKFYMLEQLKRREGVEFENHNTGGCEMAAELRFSDARRLYESVRRPQVTATEYALKHLRKSGGAVLVLPVGCGKTVCALYIAMQLRVTTLVVVGNENLIEQWRERIQEYCPGARVGTMQGPVCETKNCDFVIACTKSLSERAYPADKLRRIGLVIFDEAHHAAAPTFLTAVWQVAAPYMLALTQDPSRQDGMTHVLYHFFSYNVFIVPPSLPPGIELHVGVHRFARRCFVQDADCLSSTKLKERRHNAGQDEATLACCEALASFDKRHYSAACLASAPIAARVTASSDESTPLVPGLPRVAALHALSAWQSIYCETDVANLSYTQIYQSLQSDAHRNATIVAYVKQFLCTNDASALRQPTLEECNNVDESSVCDRSRAHVLVRITVANSSREATTTGGVLKDLYLCTRQELQAMQQVERQVLILASEKEHIDALYDRMMRSGFSESMVGVYVGGPETKKLSPEQRRELLARRVILATYAMAAEGTDIATLNTIVFATPRSSITDQAIGRALRDKLTPAIMPYILDLCDQWCEMTKRMYFTRNKSYAFYDARRHVFDDYSSFDAVGAVCWRKPRRTRTQRIADARKDAREQTQRETAAVKAAKAEQKRTAKEVKAALKDASKKKRKRDDSIADDNEDNDVDEKDIVGTRKKARTETRKRKQK